MDFDRISPWNSPVFSPGGRLAGGLLDRGGSIRPAADPSSADVSPRKRWILCIYIYIYCLCIIDIFIYIYIQYIDRDEL